MHNVLMMLQIISALLLGITLFTHGYLYGEEEVTRVSVCLWMYLKDWQYWEHLQSWYIAILKYVLWNKKLEKIQLSNHQSMNLYSKIVLKFLSSHGLDLLYYPTLTCLFVSLAGKLVSLNLSINMVNDQLKPLRHCQGKKWRT